MTLRNSLFASLAALGLVACVGGLQPTDPMGDGTGDGDGDGDGTGGGADAAPGGGEVPTPAEARAKFDSEVAPMLEASCKSCHGPAGISTKFLGAAVADHYELVKGYGDAVVGDFGVTTAPLLTKLNPGPHYGITYTVEQAASVQEWLDMEAAIINGPSTPPPGGADAGPGGPPPPTTPGAAQKRIISVWSGCMDLADWQADQVAPRWANKGSGEGTCIKCHANGQSSFLTDDAQNGERMFNVLSTNKYYMLAFFTPDVTDLANPKMLVNEPLLRKVGLREFPYTEHPDYNLEGQAYSALLSFHAKTEARRQAGTCGPPRIPE